VAFNTPVRASANTVDAEIPVNRAAIATIPEVPHGTGAMSPDRRLVWRKTFGPGSYVHSFRSGGWGMNFYALWSNNPVMANPQPPN